MVWAYMSAKPSASRSWTSASWNAFISLVSGPFSVSMASAVLMRSRMARASSASRIDSSLEVVMTSRWRRVKAARHVSRQCLDILVVVGPGESLGQLLGHVVEVQRGVAVVPAEHLEGRQVVSFALGEKWAKLICRSSPSP